MDPPLSPPISQASIESASQSLNLSIGGAQKGENRTPPKHDPGVSHGIEPKSLSLVTSSEATHVVLHPVGVQGAGHPQILANVSSRHFLNDPIGTSQHIYE